MKRIVLIAGFETFNVDLYRKAAKIAKNRCPELEILVFTDAEISSNPDQVKSALDTADVFFGSLLFDYDQVQWLRSHLEHIPIRLVFESALELMSMTQLGQFKIGDQPKGMPKPIKFILNKFSNGKEEDKLAGYISFLKIGPKLLKYIPIQKVQDLRNWLIIYGYWNAGGMDNVAFMFWTIADKYLNLKISQIPEPKITPNMGLLHPDSDQYFTSPTQYITWYKSQFKVGTNATVAILLYRKHVITEQPYIAKLINMIQTRGLIPVPIFINGVEAHIAVRDWITTTYELNRRKLGIIDTPSLSKEAIVVDAIASTIGFPLVGGPAGSMEAGRQVDIAKRILTAKNIPYIIAAPLLIQDLHSWTRKGIAGLQSVVLYALPELDGAIDTIPLGGLVGENIYLIPERVERLIGRLQNWIKLRQTKPSDRRIAIILYGFPPGYGATGTAALLNVPQSLIKVLNALQDQGYQTGDHPQDGEEIIKLIQQADQNINSAININIETFIKNLGYLLTNRIEKQWGNLSRTGIKTDGEVFHLGGVQFGNIWIGVQPPLGIAGDPMRLMFEKDLTPHPQYVAYYQWLQKNFDAIIHFGMHGTVEWLPGSPLGNTGYSWSDILLGNLPNLYIYAANNPSESILAKRRGYGVLISHNVPPYGRAGLYKELIVIRDLINEYRQDPDQNQLLREAICQKILDSGINRDCPYHEAQKLGIEFTPQNLKLFSKDSFSNYLTTLYEYLQILETRLFSSGLHILGQPPTPEQLQSYLDAYQKPDQNQQITTLLNQTTDEITNLLKGLNGEYIPPAPGGDLLRDGIGVLPTGRNIHALDPYRMPSPGAYLRGQEIALKIIAQHQKDYNSYPETVAVMLWGLDIIKTKGESLAIILELVGAQPIKEGTGRIVRYELKPLNQIGHPRIDILANLSGIFRDSFINVIELLDDLFQRAANIEEPIEQNFIRKHSLELKNQGIDNPNARLFSNPSGDYGSLVNDRVVDSNWESTQELAQTWEGRNMFSYGRQDKGTARPEILQTLLKTSSRIVQEIDSVEYGLTDIQEYYANTGALKTAAEQRKGSKVATSLVESFSSDTTPRELEDLLRIEYRTKLVNPKWAESMANQGSGGAYEISQRMTALIGWSATTDFTDQWVYDQSAQTYALDDNMANKLRHNNPEAFRNIIGRMLEANGRGFWNADPQTLQKLRSLYDQTEADLEGVEIDRA